MFGMTAKQWRDSHPDSKGNIRDYASVNELICLSNMENLNALFIADGLPRPELLRRLNQIAIGQQAFADLDRIDKFILLCVPSQPVVGNSDLAGVLRVHPADLGKRLARLVKCGLLQSAGRGRGTKYGLPMAKSSTSEPKSSTSERENANLPESAQLVRRQKKTTREEMRAAILELCAGRWLSIRDIADTLERTMSTIRPHCEVLVAEKRLQPRYLDNSNHPQQAYSTVTRGSTP